MKLAAALIAALTFAVWSGETTGIASPSYWRNWERMVRNCEAPGSDYAWWRGGWWANTGNGFFFGPQFTYSTWRAAGGPSFSTYGRLPHYSVDFIVMIAERVYRMQGPHAWPNCYRYL